MGRKSKEYNDREKKEDRKFSCILYPDSEEYDCQLILNRLPYYWTKFYYILHDSDVYSETDYDLWVLDNPDLECPFKIGDKKKPHYHVIAYSNTPLLLGRASTKFGIKSNYVRRVNKLKDAIQYLIHLNDPDKWQYRKEEIITNDEELNSYLKKNMNMNEKAKIIVNYISSSTGKITIYDVTKFALDNDCWDEFRRGQHIFTSLIIEMNLMKG